MTTPISRKSTSQTMHTTIVTLRDRAQEMLRVADHLEATEKFIAVHRAGIALRPTSHTKARTKTKAKAGGTAGTKKGPTVVAKAA